MYLETFIWCWIHMHPHHVMRRLATFLALATLVLIPLLYVNVGLVRKGHQLRAPSLEIQAAPNMPGEYYLPEEE
jgi:hypothetical protein